MYKHYEFRLRGHGAARLYSSLGSNVSLGHVSFVSDSEKQKALLVAAARKVAKAEMAGSIQITKRLDFYADRIHYRKRRSGYQIILAGLCLGWETSWGVSTVKNRCPVCGWPFEDREPPAEIIRNASGPVFSSADGFLVVRHEIVDRLEREGITGVRFVPIGDPDTELLTVSIYSGSFEVNRQRLLVEFPAMLRSSGMHSQASQESLGIMRQALEDAIEEQARSRELTGVPEEAAWMRLPPRIKDDPIFVALQRFLAGFVRREMMDSTICPPPAAGREAKWYALVLESPLVPEDESTVSDPVTACPECGLRPVLAGSLRLPRTHVQDREIFETSSGWLVASDGICKILREYDAFAMAPVTLVG